MQRCGEEVAAEIADPPRCGNDWPSGTWRHGLQVSEEWKWCWRCG